MNQYDRRMVFAPEWMKHFACIAGNCTETCCQQWNIDVDPVHAECYTHLGDPELQSIMDHLLRRFRIRRPGMQKPELQYRLHLLEQPGKRCPLLNENFECRLQKKYGADILCDTCYFHPRTFWQIDDQTCMSACLSCPECARLALFHTAPTVFSQFENEIDPNAEWLETSLILDPKARILLQNRQTMIRTLSDILQDRRLSFDRRLSNAEAFFTEIIRADNPDQDVIRSVCQKILDDPVSNEKSDDPAETIKLYLEVFDPVWENREKPVQGIAEFTRALAGGRESFVLKLAENFEEGCRIMTPFLNENEYLTENFMIHSIFSDCFKEFHRYQNEPVTAADILRHESSLLQIWYLFLRIQLAQSALSAQTMTETLYLQTVIQIDRTFWHYPDWFARCAERAVKYRSAHDQAL